MASFLSTLSLRRATHIGQHIGCTVDISIHALLAESDPPVLATSPAPSKFLSTLSLRRATAKLVKTDARKQFISIHALLAESDSKRLCNALEHLHFYPRSPCGERLNSIRLVKHISRFLSTLSLRRATHHEWSGSQQPENFYPRSPCGERLGRAFWPGLSF